MIFKNSKLYDVLKWIALTGCYALWYGWTKLAEVWGFPFASQISETIIIVGAVIGILVGVSGIAYQRRLEDDEEEFVEKTSEDEIFTPENNGETEDIQEDE